MAKFERIGVNIFYLYRKSIDSYLGLDEDDNFMWNKTDNKNSGDVINLVKGVVDSIILEYTNTGMCYSHEILESITEDEYDDEDDYAAFLCFTHNLGKFINDNINDIMFIPIEIFYRESGVNIRYNNLHLITSSKNFTIYQKILGEYFSVKE